MPDSGPVGSEVIVNGTNLLDAVSVKFNGVDTSSFTVVSSTRILVSVPPGATTGAVRVTTPMGDATTGNAFTVTGTATMDMAIDGFYITQSVQDYPDFTTPLVRDRSAWVRVFVKANAGNGAYPQVRVLFINGDTTNTLTIDAPGPGVPTRIDEGDSVSSWNAPVPAAWMQEGVRVIAVVDPEVKVAEADKGNNTYPLDGNPLAVSVSAVDPIRITLFPVTTGDGLTGNVSAENLSAYVDLARRIFPVPDSVDATIGAGMTSSVMTLAPDGSGWIEMLNEVSAKRAAEGSPDRNYYGVVKVGYWSGVAGLGCVGCPLAVGWDGSEKGKILAHELGHNFGRLHAPGCGAGNVDPGYPSKGNYANGRIGVTGWDPYDASNNLKSPTSYNDIMNYCGLQWTSDYGYKKTFEFLSQKTAVMRAAERRDARDGLLIWGRVAGGKVVLQPVLPVKAAASSPDPGPYTLEVADASGRVMGSVSFGALPVEDFPGTDASLFSFVYPCSPEDQAAVHTLRVLREGLEVGRVERRTQVRAPETGAPVTVAVRKAPDAEGSLSLAWDHSIHPLVVVRDAATGEILSFHRRGEGNVRAPKGKELDIIACDGVGAHIQRIDR